MGPAPSAHVRHSGAPLGSLRFAQASPRNTNLNHSLINQIPQHHGLAMAKPKPLTMHN